MRCQESVCARRVLPASSEPASWGCHHVAGQAAGDSLTPLPFERSTATGRHRWRVRSARLDDGRDLESVKRKAYFALTRAALRENGFESSGVEGVLAARRDALARQCRARFGGTKEVRITRRPRRGAPPPPPSAFIHTFSCQTNGLHSIAANGLYGCHGCTAHPDRRLSNAAALPHVRAFTIPRGRCRARRDPRPAPRRSRTL